MRASGAGAAQRVLEGARSGPHLHKSKRPISVGLANVAVWTSDDDNTFCRITAGGLGMGGGGIADALRLVAAVRMQVEMGALRWRSVVELMKNRMAASCIHAEVQDGWEKESRRGVSRVLENIRESRRSTQHGAHFDDFGRAGRATWSNLTESAGQQPVVGNNCVRAQPASQQSCRGLVPSPSSRQS